MVRLLPLLILLSSPLAYSESFGFADGKLSSKIPPLLNQLKELEMKVDPNFEESFNQGVKQVENAVEEEKLYCAGEASDASGKILDKEQRQLCFRKLKKYYLAAMETVFNLKKKYLGLLHTQQVEKLSAIHKKLQQDIEKNF